MDTNEIETWLTGDATLDAVAACLHREFGHDRDAEYDDLSSESRHHWRYKARWVLDALRGVTSVPAPARAAQRVDGLSGRRLAWAIGEVRRRARHGDS